MLSLFSIFRKVSRTIARRAMVQAIIWAFIVFAPPAFCQSAVDIPKLLADYLKEGPGLPRKALVVGIGVYDHAPKVENAENDAKAMAKALEAVKFKQTLKFNLTREQFLDEFDLFANGLNPGDIAVVFYAGHGVELGYDHYLVAKDSKNAEATRISTDNVRLSYFIEKFSDKKLGLGIIVLDSCRTDPFPAFRLDARNLKSREQITIQSTPNVIIVYSTGPGEIAMSGAATGTNSPFTRVFHKQLNTSGEELDFILRQTKIGVELETLNPVTKMPAQNPWWLGSRKAGLVLVHDADSLEQERKRWIKILLVGSRREVEYYLELFPDSRYASSARKWLDDNPENFAPTAMPATALLHGSSTSLATVTGALSVASFQTDRPMGSSALSTIVNVAAGIPFFSRPRISQGSVAGTLIAGQKVSFVSSDGIWATIDIGGKTAFVPGVSTSFIGVAEKDTTKYLLPTVPKPTNETLPTEITTQISRLGKEIATNAGKRIIVESVVSGNTDEFKNKVLAFERALDAKIKLIDAGVRRNNISLESRVISQHPLSTSQSYLSTTVVNP